MIKGNSQEFIDGLYYGDERFFVYCKKKYFIQVYCENGDYVLEIYIIELSDNKFHWKAISDNDYSIKQFKLLKIFNGKTFWEVENEIEWVDD